MEKIIIDKEFLKNFETIKLIFDNIDVYEVSINNILDVYSEAKLIDKKRKEYDSLDGFIKISKSACETKEYRIVNKLDKISEDYCNLLERLQMDDGSVDITCFSLRRKGEKDMYVYFTYDPLMSVLDGLEIEYTNCPSLEIDSDGNMIIAFGERSKLPKRKDNNYAELIEGAKNVFLDNLPAKLLVNVDRIATFGIDKIKLSVSFSYRDKKRKKKYQELVFVDCKDLTLESYFPISGECEIFVSKLQNGRIYVGFDSLGMEFTCETILDYDYYCSQNKKLS